MEITDVNKAYLKLNELSVETFSRGFAWLDTGTRDALLDACNFIAAIEKRQGLKVACLEEIAWKNGFINPNQIAQVASTLKNEYGDYLNSLISRENIQ